MTPPLRSPLRLAVLLLVAVGAGSGVAANELDKIYGDLLIKYVKKSSDGINRVHYARWKENGEDRRKLDGYILALAELKPSAMKREEAFAYWGNLYNAVTLKVVLDDYPVKSIKQISSPGAWLDPKAWLGGPWRATRVRVEGKNLSLDDIEHSIIRPTYRDPRAHYMLNCASIGCPNLLPRPWRADTLEADLDEAARAFINHSRGVSIGSNGQLTVSSIFRWFGEDFGGNDPAIIAHIVRYAEPGLAGALKAKVRIDADGYNWSLNDAVSE